MSVRILIGDCRERLRDLPDASVDSVVCDPPYHLTSIVKRFSKATPEDADKNGALRKAPTQGCSPYKRTARGFMGQTWDGGDVAFDPETWAEVLRVLKPGGHLVAFSGTRTYHRMAVAIEDAGFEIRDQLAWVYGSGFPKSHDVSKAIDKAAHSIPLFETIRSHVRHWKEARGHSNKSLNEALGLETNGCGMARHWTSTEGGQHSIPSKDQWRNLKRVLQWPDCELDSLYDAVKDGAERPVLGKRDAAKLAVAPGQDNDRSATVLDITAPATEAAQQWQGWGTALKPSWEPILFGSKPVTVEQHFAILIHELTARFAEVAIWLNLSAPDAGKRINAIQAKCAEAAHIVLDSAKIRSLESIGIAPSVAQGSTFSAPASSASTRTKGCSALSHVRPSGSEELAPDQTIHPGAVADTLIRLMDISTSVITGDISENTVWSWLDISDAILSETSRFTIETVTRLTTALRTLSFSLRENTSSDTGSFSPNWEPICLARKPLDGTVANNVLKHGTGALNIDGCRIEAQGRPAREVAPMRDDYEYRGNALEGRVDGSLQSSKAVGTTDLGRWPANLCHDGSDEVVAGFPETESNSGKPFNKAGVNEVYGKYGAIQSVGITDSGSAARFFFEAKYNEDELLFCRAKAMLSAWSQELANSADDSSNLSNEHAVFALRLAATLALPEGRRLNALTGLSTSATPSELRRLATSFTAAILSIESGCLPEWLQEKHTPTRSPVQLAGTPRPTDTITITISHWKSSGCAEPVTFSITPQSLELGAKDLAPARFKYCAKATTEERGEGNNHPTVKPVALMRWLCRLVTPVGGTVLDPFAGSGSTLIAADAEQFNAIGCELSPDYAAIAAKRIREAGGLFADVAVEHAASSQAAA